MGGLGKGEAGDNNNNISTCKGSRDHYEYINSEAIDKDRVVKVTKLQAVLRGRKLAMGQRRAPALTLLHL